jgi:hypothetical protein
MVQTSRLNRSVAAKLAGQARYRQGGAEHLERIRKLSPAHDPDPVKRRHHMSRLALRRWHGGRVKVGGSDVPV